MFEQKVTLDRDSFKALSSTTRIAVLKALDVRRKTLTELSEELGVSKPALLKHLDPLLASRLVSKEDRERKWIYYSLTLKAKNLLHPERIRIALSLGMAGLALAGGLFSFARFLLPPNASGGTTFARTSNTPVGDEGGDAFLSPPTQSTSNSLAPVLLLVAGIGLIVAACGLVYAAWRLRRDARRRESTGGFVQA